MLFNIYNPFLSNANIARGFLTLIIPIYAFHVNALGVMIVKEIPILLDTHIINYILWLVNIVSLNINTLK